MFTQINKIHQGDCIELLTKWPDNFADCCVTSPPYWGLRDYGHAGQIGLEETPELYVAKMKLLFYEVRRVLKPEGTLWLNLGDSYSGGGRGGTDPENCTEKQKSNRGTNNMPRSIVPEGLPQKNLIGIPWRVAFTLQESGWYLRQDIIWAKPNPMPESVTDRCTKSHEYIFLMSKSPQYYFNQDAIKEPLTLSSKLRLAQDVDSQKGSERVPFKTNGTMKAVAHKSARTPGQTPHGKALKRMSGEGDPDYIDRNKRSVWTVTTKPFSGAHFATFPEDLIRPCILAGCPAGGIVLDPFMGAGTTALVAKKNGCNFIGCELNPEYIEIAEKRIAQEYLF